MADNTVVPNFQPLNEDEFHSAFSVSLARMIRTHGKAKVAQWMEISIRQLGNIQAGSTPGARSIFNLLAHDRTAHDEIDAEYGLRKVDKEAVCTTDPLTLSLITLARDVAEAESPDSPGGCTVTDHEVLRMDEPLLRKVHRVTGTWLERLTTMRKPRRVA